MGMLAFFPWMRVETPLQIGAFHLVPFQRGEAPAGAGTPEQHLTDAALAPYVRAGGAPINVATIAYLHGKALTADLEEAERGELFLFARAVALAGLADREFFSLAGYCNTSRFAFVVQGFREEPDGTFVSARRRDGRTWIRVTADGLSRPGSLPLGG